MMAMVDRPDGVSTVNAVVSIVATTAGLAPLCFRETVKRNMIRR